VVMVGQMGGADSSAAQITAEAGLLSSYVFRGQVRNNDLVAQPQMTIAQHGVSFNLWGNYDLGENGSGISSDFSEINLTLAYTLPLNINEMAFDVGVINYNYMGMGASESTSELFARATVLSWQDYVIPSVTFFGDIDEVNGTYILFDVVAPYQVSDYLSVEGGVSAGWGNTSYNDAYWAAGTDAGWNDYNFYGNASYEIMDNLTASVNLTFTMLEGGSVRDSAKTNYDGSKQKFWGGVGIAYDF